MAADCQEETARPSLILVDDHRMFVEMLLDSLAGGYDIAGVAYRADELLALLETSTADCLVLDLQLPDRSDLSPDVTRDPATGSPALACATPAIRSANAWGG